MSKPLIRCTVIDFAKLQSIKLVSKKLQVRAVKDCEVPLGFSFSASSAPLHFDKIKFRKKTKYREVMALELNYLLCLIRDDTKTIYASLENILNLEFF